MLNEFQNVILFFAGLIVGGLTIWFLMRSPLKQRALEIDNLELLLQIKEGQNAILRKETELQDSTIVQFRMLLNSVDSTSAD